MNVGDSELLNYLIGNMTQGGTAGNSAYGGLEPPKAADIAAFRTASQSAGSQTTGDDVGQPGPLLDGVGTNQGTAALPGVYNADNTQLADKTGQNIPTQNGDNDDKKSSGTNANSAADEAQQAKLDDEMKKQGEISSLTSQIQQLQQQLQMIDRVGGASSGGQSSSLGDGGAQTVSQASPERTALVSLIQQLQQQLQVLIAS